MIGRTVGRFRVLAPLGRGGMASVWRARDELLGREIALKVLAESLAQSPDSRRRFRHEAKVAAQLDHPGIAAVYDSGENDGVTWIAMVLIDGESLADRLARSLPPPAEVVCVALAVADALGHAHSQGVVHRDVTARNVMLGRDGRIFVLDFGLALAQDASRISSSGTLVGTAPYMAPEVLQGATANPRSDLYSVGVLLYEALTGAPPFVSASPAAMAFATLHQPVPAPRSLRPELSAELEAVVLRCMARDPGARFADTAALAAALRACPEAARATGPSAAAVATVATSAARSASAERLASGTGPVYLAAPRFAFPDAVADVAADAALAESVSAAARSGLSQLRRLHVVPCDTPPPEPTQDARREYVRAAGANLLLAGTLRRVGTRLRAAYEVIDPEAGLQISGDAVEGTTFDPFDLEERLAASLRRALGGEASATRARPPDPAAPERFQQALRYMERHDNEASVDGAIAILERLIESEGEKGELLATLGRACLMKYELTRQHSLEARGATAIERAAQLAPDSPDTVLALGDLHRVSGKLEEAVAEYRRVLAARPDCFEARHGRARALGDMNRSDEAIAECLRGIEEHPGDWRGNSLLGYLYFTNGRYELALEAWQKVVTLIPNSAKTAFNLGSALFHLDRFEDATRQFERSIQIQPYAPAFTNLGTVLFFTREYEAAAAAFEKSVALRPSDPVMWGNLGNACRLIPGYEERAKAALERAVGLMLERLERNPGESESWGRLAGWFANLGRIGEAERAITEALRLGPQDSHCMARALHVYWQVGDRARALHWTREALRHGYGVQALKRSPDLAALREDPEFQKVLLESPDSGGGRLPGPDGQKEVS